MCHRNYTAYSVLAFLIVVCMLGCSKEREDLSIPMKAGDYQITVTKVTNGIKDPLDKTKTRCYRELAFDPYKNYHQNKDCKITDVVKTETQVSFTIDCQNGALAEAKSKMKYSVNGDNIKWSTTISKIGGKEMDITVSGTGKYVGKCK